MINIGLVYAKGSVPGFEDFGNIPTSLVGENGLVGGVPASKELDGIIIPGGSLIESNSIDCDLFNEIKIMAKDGKPVLGVCAGYQVLGNSIDIGRKSPVPIVKEGLGLLDVDFSPLINNDRVKAEVVGDSFLTKNLSSVDGFHTHTYGNVEGDAKTLFYSYFKRANYGDVDKRVVSGSVNDDGNVVGTMIHNILDDNPEVVSNFFDFLGAGEDDISSVFDRNIELKKELHNSVGINNGIHVEDLSVDSPFYKFKKRDGEFPYCLIIGSTGSDSGKTFLTTGLVGALREKGLNVGVLKVGPDVRDTISSLYLTKGKMEDFASIKIGHLGWMDLNDVLNSLKNSSYDVVLIEGVMSVFTGLLNERIPYSTSEIAVAGNIPMLLASGVNKGGIESAAVDLSSHAKMLSKMGVNVNGILFNKVYDVDIFNNVVPFVKDSTGVDNIFYMKKAKLEERGATPEVEIRYDLFSLKALEFVKDNLNLLSIVEMSGKPNFSGYLGFDDIKGFFNR